ncbi:MAG: 50S ribosomal protein L9 [Wenzhouxiangellaceae bacterium]
MELILLEKVHNLGDLGDTVDVKPGYGRNFLLPRGKAVAATRENKEKFESERDELQRQAGDKLASAEARREAIDELESIVFTVNVSPEGRLYGSISAREIADKLTEMGYPVEKAEVDQPEGPIRETGEYTVGLILHADVITEIKVEVVAQSA